MICSFFDDLGKFNLVEFPPKCTKFRLIGNYFISNMHFYQGQLQIFPNNLFVFQVFIPANMTHCLHRPSFKLKKSNLNYQKKKSDEQASTKGSNIVSLKFEQNNIRVF